MLATQTKPLKLPQPLTLNSIRHRRGAVQDPTIDASFVSRLVKLDHLLADVGFRAFRAYQAKAARLYKLGVSEN